MNANANANDDASLDAESLELLAAYADGMLAPDQRRAAESLLARSEPAREVLAETIRLLDVEEPRATSSHPGGRLGAAHRYRSAWRIGVPLAAAAALVLYVSRQPDPTASDEVISLLSESNATQITGWEVKPWSTVRGEGLSNVGVAAFRIGVLWTDYLAAAAADTAAARRALAEILALLESIPLSSPAALTVRELRPSGTEPSQLRETEDALCDVTDCDSFRAGVWLEAIRLWSVSGADPRASRGLRDSVRSLETGSAPHVRILLERLRAELGRPAPDADSVSTIVNMAIRDLAR